MRIQIIFENNIVFDWHMFENNFVNRWLKMMQEHVEEVPSKHDYELTLQGLGPADEFKRLHEIMETCNNHRRGTIPSYFINRKEFTLKNLSDIHYIYEEIAQQPEWLKGSLCENEAIKARDLLNDYIHQAESKAGSVSGLQKSVTPRVRFRIVNPSTGVPNARKENFEESDYQLFDPFVHSYTMYLNYNAVGEDFLKTFKSGRSPNDAVPLKQYSPSFFFVLEAPEYDVQYRRIDQCKRWMIEGGYDPKDPKNSLGHIPMARLFKTENDKVYEDTLVYSKIREVRIT